MAKMDHGCSSFLEARSSMSKIMIVSLLPKSDGRMEREVNMTIY